jgi:hypothetical protein
VRTSVLSEFERHCHSLAAHKDIFLAIAHNPFFTLAATDKKDYELTMSLTHFTESTSLVVEENNPFNNLRGPGTTISPQLFPHWLPLVLILCAGLLLIFGTSEHATNQSQLLAIAIAMETAAFLIFYHDLHEVRADVKTIDQKIDKNHAEAMTKMDTLSAVQ